MRSYRDQIYIPVLLYSMTGAMFQPVVHSMIYRKVCIWLSNETGIHDCFNPLSESAKNQRIQTEANRVVLFGSICICIAGMLTSSFIGRVGDKRSRKLSMLMPFVGLILSDIMLLLQAIFFESSPYWFPFSELVFGCFGGYMTILSTSFAYITSIPGVEANDKSKNVSRLEGTLGLGSVLGFLISSQLDLINYVNMFLMFTIVHICCFCYIAQMKEHMNFHQERRDVKLIPSLIICGRNANFQIIICYIVFGASYLAFLGSSHILFFYLKQRFYWDAEMFSYLRAITQTCSTIMALFVYPLCKSFGIRDVVLVTTGLIARGLARMWYAMVWNSISVFGVVLFEMFARFPASGLRSLISKNANANEQGEAFAMVAVLQGGCKVISAVVFNTMFPWSISFMPQLSFILMAVLIIPPTILIWYYRDLVDQCTTTNKHPDVGLQHVHPKL
ncbi:hypothetical protein KIN20_036796 [Parelaphostrongylus tenuis]|uniref:Proton-coupled folate transporter n=1 Tax=Parelaphostrongylus tenuis TaxID=148309 RepID=A0AAD5RDV9_PARTN|nr:hypothetical protein KIN20_036796 [Parelaphostrongylus tenuis]